MGNSAGREPLQEISAKDRHDIRDHVVARTPRAESSREVSIRRNALSGWIAFSTFLGGGLLAGASGYRLVRQLPQYPFDTSGATWDLIMAVISDNYPLVAGLLFSSILIIVGLRELWRSVGDFFLSLLESDAGS